MTLKRISTIRTSKSSPHTLSVSWRKQGLQIAAVILTTATLLASVPLAAHAAPPEPVAAYDNKTVSTSTLVVNPDRAASEELHQAIEKVKAQDPLGFEVRLNLITSSKAVSKYLKSFKGLDRDVQIEGMAASMPTDALTGMIDLMEKKILEYKVRPASDSSNWVTMIVNKDAMASYTSDSGTPTTFGWGSFPQCPSAWAAFWAWFAFNTAFCGPFAAYPPAAVACALGLGLAGMIVDFNRGC
ncbi:hypothetical protein [Arthrobacter sp. YN]|uniref:hypothetical protein n=1 Tax=Arthrobacter sp. YN TaxID=2020486 RepID=UPI000B5FD013|nr:hypothetical protein [Arthrobacter sp. YN]ASN19304.1 hypothetical protein CGK93_06065 [Arthrobacter sp. YN]